MTKHAPRVRINIREGLRTMGGGIGLLLLLLPVAHGPSADGGNEAHLLSLRRWGHPPLWSRDVGAVVLGERRVGVGAILVL